MIFSNRSISIEEQRWVLIVWILRYCRFKKIYTILCRNHAMLLRYPMDPPNHHQMDTPPRGGYQRVDTPPIPGGPPYRGVPPGGPHGGTPPGGTPPGGTPPSRRGVPPGGYPALLIKDWLKKFFSKTLGGLAAWPDFFLPPCHEILVHGFHDKKKCSPDHPTGFKHVIKSLTTFNQSLTTFEKSC